ncbi:MAG: flavodoxin domain-containing protein [Pseudomonadota bacterium]
MTVKLHLLYGTETGTAEFLCDDMKDAMDDGVECKISNMEDVDPATLDGDVLNVLVSSTFGSGEVPGSAQPFYDKLVKNKPDLSHVRFAMFGLGDRTFDMTFNQGSEKIMEAMLACSAKQVGERGIFDASSPDMPEDIAIPWLQGILADEAVA